ncbi:Lysosomal protective protein [Fragariocoptes setiger]|uniref:Lysosomal protective protein n=1 Tax=Fragariocoptes setiger TaxID=1670756 RepID=A0ABQ7S8M3_9ACAR|nr:Lysosomal protective protein [Fragariocoptes setiger]
MPVIIPTTTEQAGTFEMKQRNDDIRQHRQPQWLVVVCLIMWSTMILCGPNNMSVGVRIAAAPSRRPHEVPQANLSSVNDDLIARLPGQMNNVSFKQYSGYVPANLAGDQMAHYVLVESESSPDEAPLVLWLQGGPGCSSLLGYFNEHGPFKVSPNGQQLVDNEYSWNKVANVLYLDTPANVGYSYYRERRSFGHSRRHNTNNNLTTTTHYNSDDTLALSNYVALRNFFTKFPALKRNKLYLMGEGYAGILLTTLGVLLNADSSIHLSGLALGNAYVDRQLSRNVSVLFGYHRGLYGQSTWRNLSLHCCAGREPALDVCNFGDNLSTSERAADKLCAQALDMAVSYELDATLNKYNVLADCKQQQQQQLRQLSSSSSNDDDDDDIRYSLECVDHSAIGAYLARADVRQALHIPAQLMAWNECTLLANYEQIYSDIRQQMRTLLASPRKLRFMLYSGDVHIGDTNFWVNELFVDQVASEQRLKLLSDYRPWKAESRSDQRRQQVAGYVKHYDGLVFMTIKGAGMFVATDRPQWALEFFTRFVESSHPTTTTMIETTHRDENNNGLDGLFTY